MPREVLVLEVQGRGFRRITSRIDRANKSASALRTTLGFLRSALVVFASVRILQGFIELADSLTLIRNRIRTVTTSVAQLNQVQSRLFQISQKTRTSFEANATVFARLARAAGGLGLTYNDLLDITQGLNQAVQISGSTAQEAKNALIQFSQGLASGALQGEELRSVSEQIPRLAEAIGREFGIAAGQLIAFNRESPGVFTTERIIRALRTELPRLNKEFKDINITISQAFERFNNALLVFVGRTNQATGVTRLLADALVFVADNLDKVALALSAIAALVVFNVLTDQVARFGKAIKFLILVALSPLLNILRIIRAVAFAAVAALALLSFPIIGISLIALTVAFFTFREEIDNIIKSAGGLDSILRTVGNAIVATFGFLSKGDNIALLNDILGDLVLGFITSIPATFLRLGEIILTQIGLLAIAIFAKLKAFVSENLDELLSTVTNFFIKAFNQIFSQLKPTKIGDLGVLGDITLDLSKLQIAEVDVKKTTTSISDLFVGMGETIANVGSTLGSKLLSGEFLTKSQEMENALKGLAAASNEFQKELESATSSDKIVKGFDKIKGIVSDIFKFFKSLVSAGTIDADLLKDIVPTFGAESILVRNAKELEKLLGQVDPGIKSVNGLRKAVEILTNAQRDNGISAEDASRAYVLLMRRAAGVSNAATIYRAKLEALNFALKNNAISQNEFNDALRAAAIEFLNTQRSFTAGFNRFFLKFADDATNTAKNVETILSATFQSLEDQLVQLATTGEISFRAIAQAASQVLIRTGIRQVLGSITDALTPRPDAPEERIATTVKSAFEQGANSAVLILNAGIAQAFSNAATSTVAQIAAASQAGIGSIPPVDPDLFSTPDASLQDREGFGTLDETLRQSTMQGAKEGTETGVSVLGPTITSVLGPLINSFANFLGGASVGSSFGSLATSIGTSLAAGSFESAANGLDFGVSAATSAATLSGGGVDNRLIAFRANDREEVSVRPKGSGGAGGINLNMTVVTNDADSFRKHQGQILNDGFTAAQRASRRFS